MAVKNEWSLDDGKITFGTTIETKTQAIDPVCGMTVAADAEHAVIFGGRHYRFCSASCRQKFLNDASRYEKSALETDKGGER